MSVVARLFDLLSTTKMPPIACISHLDLSVMPSSDPQVVCRRRVAPPNQKLLATPSAFLDKGMFCVMLAVALVSQIEILAHFFCHR